MVIFEYFTTVIECNIPIQKITAMCSNVSQSNNDFIQVKQFIYTHRIGIEMNNGGDIVNLTDACDRMPNNMMDFLNGGSELLELAERYCINAGIGGSCEWLPHAT